MEALKRAVKTELNFKAAKREQFQSKREKRVDWKERRKLERLANKGSQLRMTKKG